MNLQHNKQPNLHFIEADATKLPFEDHSFDVVISNTVQEHIEPSKFFGEQFRILRKGGVCLVLSARRGIYIAADCISAQSSYEEEIWKKVFDTLAALLPAGVHATGHEQQFARAAGRVKNIRVVFHGEQPVKHRSLFPQSYTPADIQQKFKALFKAIDPRALVVSSRTMPARIPWTVQP